MTPQNMPEQREFETADAVPHSIFRSVGLALVVLRAQHALHRRFCYPARPKGLHWPCSSHPNSLPHDPFLLGCPGNPLTSSVFLSSAMARSLRVHVFALAILAVCCLTDSANAATTTLQLLARAVLSSPISNNTGPGTEQVGGRGAS